MPTVTVEGEKSFEVEPGKKLVLAIEDAGIDIMHRCGGNARCTTCRVQVLAGDAPAMEGTEQERLAKLISSPTLACRARFVSNPTCGSWSSTAPVKPESHRNSPFGLSSTTPRVVVSCTPAPVHCNEGLYILPVTGG